MRVIEYAKTFLGKPYHYGSNGADSVDCSGLVNEVLKGVGVLGYGDRNAQMLYNELSKMNLRSQLSEGAIVFYGKSKSEISHVAIMIEDDQIIEAGGGDSTTTTIERAREQGSMVRIRPITHRKDIVAVILPAYKQEI